MEHQRILADTAALARARGWATVTAFTGSLQDPADRTLTLYASAGTDSTPLRAWLESAGHPVTTGDLESAPTLTANRVIVALQCGQLLTPEAVEAATAMLARPSPTVRVVMVGAEALAGPGDLQVVERSAWRLLVGDPDEEWAGQNLAERGCLLWSGTALTPRVERDRELLTAWANTPGEDLIGGARAAYALALADREHADQQAAASTREQRHLASTRTTVAEAGQRLLRRLDSDLLTYERQVAASLQMLEQDLVNGLEAYLSRHRQQLSDSGAVAVVNRYYEQGVQRWRRTNAAAFSARVAQINSETADLLDDVDWDLVNRVAPHASGRTYPGVLADGVQLTPDTDTSDPRMAASWRPPEKSSELPMTLVGGALTGAVALTFGVGLLPAAALGTLGATGTHLVGRYLRGGQAEQEIAVQARGAIVASVATVRQTAAERIKRSLAASKRQMAWHFDRLDQALDQASPEPDDTAGDQLRALRQRL
ncbi:hypothetical protein Aph01nite_77400 [Acrocarpospora phusangensis]|uniref:Uncharacterized protein n=1 Tax=Acrocarpospora phusangensis TaxID=1070424 RepID=A0A919QL20_9ACTN|nr:hypothetical protein [Acrocarpospora phusangensis]GIH29430.1 hypothetical protein Aph01nite_77400 [Acrocarpospora phusangensis]